MTGTKIANYSTSISSHKSVAEIQQMLAQHGARRVMFENDEMGEPTGIAFVVPGPSGAEVAFRLPADWRRVQAVLRRQRVQSSFSTDQHSRRVAWRLVRDWLRVQLAMVEAEAVDLAEVFMPYMLTRGGDTAYQLWQRGGLEALPRGDAEEEKL
jgi:hypothetical protein